MHQEQSFRSCFDLFILLRYTELPWDRAVQGNIKTEAGRRQGRAPGGSQGGSDGQISLAQHVSLSSGSTEQAGRYRGHRLPKKVLILRPAYSICCWQKSPALQSEPEK